MGSEESERVKASKREQASEGLDADVVMTFCFRVR